MPGIVANKRAFLSLLLIMLFLSTYFLPFFLASQPASAATVTQRKITIGSSKVSTANTYSVSFIPGSTTSIKAIVVDFCNSAGGGPLLGTVCSSANHPVSGIQTSGSITVTQTSGFGSASFTAVAPNTNIGSGKALVIQDSGGTGGSTDATHAVTFSFTATNPSAVGSFYARIFTFSTTADSTTYDSTGSVANPGSNVIDSGGIALSTTSELTISARVQEVLQFCVGTTSVDDATTTIANDCGGTFAGNCGTSVDLGVLDGSVISTSPVATTPGAPGYGNGCNGAAMVRTNAGGGVAVTYFAEQDTGSGKLKIPGATCSGSSTTDNCFNDSSTQATFTAGQEDFGVDVAGTNCNGTTTVSYSCSMSSGTNQLKAVSGYIGNTTTAYGVTNGFAWNDTGISSPTQIASSSGPVEDETLILKFSATPGITTPTGTYNVTSDYIATPTF